MTRRIELKKALSAEGLAELKLAVVAAHPDDETIGAASRLMHCRQVFIVTVTDGSPQNTADAQAAGFQTAEEYATARRIEQNSAMEFVQLPSSRILRLNFRDQEATQNLADLVDSLSQTLKKMEPDLILTHPYEGGHPDHDATALAVHICRKLASLRDESFPHVAEFASYHAFHGERRIGYFLDFPNHPVLEFWLSEKESAQKRLMFDNYRSQKQNLKGFETQIQVERFRNAPSYDFSRSPSSESLYYDSQPWGMKSEQWRESAKLVLKKFGLFNENVTAL
jgi:N-acetylglucosamine malate deacetylase 2